MPIVNTQMDTPFASNAIHTVMATQPLITIIACPMYNSKAQPDGCNQEEFLNVPVNYSRPTKMERSYATIISTVLERLSGRR